MFVVGKKSFASLIFWALGPMIFLSACASKSRPSQPYGRDDKSETTDPLLFPPAIEGHDLEDEVVKMSRIEQLKRSPVAVWIDGAGFDAIESLGFLQTLEKAGVKPSLVVGSGFGCWVALSWAIDGSSNRAEWQTFKWSDWTPLADSSILNRLRGRDGQDEFAEHLAKIFPSQKVASLKVPADCIYLEEQNGLYFYKSSREDLVEAALWRQLNIEPLVSRARAQAQIEEKKYSGYAFSWPETAALRFAAMEAGKDNPSYTWIVWRGYRGAKLLTGAQHKFRSEKSRETLVEMTTRGLLYSLSTNYKYSPAEIKDPTQRRKILLRGRKAGEAFLSKLLEEDVRSEFPAAGR